jgi:hypothetical protein
VNIISDCDRSFGYRFKHLIRVEQYSCGCEVGHAFDIPHFSSEVPDEVHELCAYWTWHCV